MAELGSYRSKTLKTVNFGRKSPNFGLKWPKFCPIRIFQSMIFPKKTIRTISTPNIRKIYSGVMSDFRF